MELECHLAFAHTQSREHEDQLPPWSSCHRGGVAGIAAWGRLWTGSTTWAWMGLWVCFLEPTLEGGVF